MMSDELYDLFVGEARAGAIAVNSLKNLTRQVREMRTAEPDDIEMTDAEIAVTIQEYARDLLVCPACGGRIVVASMQSSAVPWIWQYTCCCGLSMDRVEFLQGLTARLGELPAQILEKTLTENAIEFAEWVQIDTAADRAFAAVRPLPPDLAKGDK